MPSNEQNMTALHVRVSKEERAAFNALADSEDTTVSALIRQYVKEAVTFSPTTGEWV